MKATLIRLFLPFLAVTVEDILKDLIKAIDKLNTHAASQEQEAAKQKAAADAARDAEASALAVATHARVVAANLSHLINKAQ